jgi:hypothetical protein
MFFKLSRPLPSCVRQALIPAEFVADAVAVDPEARALPVLNTERTSPVMSGMNRSTSTPRTRARLEVLESRRWFTIQRESSPRGIGAKMPEDGFNLVAADPAPEEAGTRVSI